ncbi:MAG: phosphatidate cytidylyltransferase, partial [Spiroplasma sp.]|nr:phosphatidate cytidylyltransferase [Mycoplasmatales bacterium]
IIINAFDSTLLALFVGIIMLNDTCAYFVGINFGKTKFSKVSPKKSVEGLFGGVIGSTLATLLIIGFFELFFPGFINIKVGVSAIIGFCIIIDVFAILGDLLESKLKRTIGIKDSGTIVYGHGGILDRLDSWVLAAIPVATYIMFF